MQFLSWHFNFNASAEIISLFKLICYSILSTLKLEAIYSSETSVDSQRATRRYIPEDRMAS
jgi:hypothetical protein